MSKIGLFYSFNSHKTSQVAKLIADEFGADQVELVNVETTNGVEFSKYDRLICGASTWFDGELPNYWDELIPDLEELSLKGKQIALFGNGDQVGYPQNFGDAIGVLAELFESCGARMLGYTSPDGYTFVNSRAIKNEVFQGLVIDFENQSKLTKGRVKEWVKQLKSEFK